LIKRGVEKKNVKGKKIRGQGLKMRTQYNEGFGVFHRRRRRKKKKGEFRKKKTGKGRMAEPLERTR